MVLSCTPKVFKFKTYNNKIHSLTTIHCFQFPVHTVFLHKRFNEELSKAIQSTFEVFLLNFKVEYCLKCKYQISRVLNYDVNSIINRLKIHNLHVKISVLNKIACRT